MDEITEKTWPGKAIELWGKALVTYNALGLTN
jgi:hypothetical protein